MRQALAFTVALLLFTRLPAAPPALSGAPPPPITFQDESGNRFITLEYREDKKVKVAFRSVGAPGQYGRWFGDGEQTEKGIVFAQTVEEGDRGAFYLATGGQGRLVVKLKPGQSGAQDAGLTGAYHHVSEEKIASLLKKDAELAEKKIEETLKTAAHRFAAEDKPAFAEWKKRWPDLHKRLIALSGEVKFSASGVPPKPGEAAKPASTSTPASPAVEQAAHWMAVAETAGSATAFLSQPLPTGLKPGWEGLYDDGFGGSVDIQELKSGGIKITLNASRLGNAQSGTVEEFIGADKVKNNPTGTEGTADFLDKNPDVTDPAQQTQIHLHRIGHFLVVETQYAERYAGRGFFDGVYLKHPSPPAE